MIKKSLSLFLLLLCSVAGADEFPSIRNSEPDETAQPPSAEEALKRFDLPAGFTATLFASEPEVQNPIAMTWDGRGRLWIAENYTYAERQTRFDLSMRDRVLILEDTDHDGKADKRTVFTDKVSVLTSVEVGRGGIWLMCPPQLLFLPDANGDDVPDGEPVVVLDGFTVAEANYHNFANGLRWGPDGWLYGRVGHSCPGRVGVPGTPDAERIPMKGGLWRFHPQRKVFEMVTHGTTNPWGHDWDRHGELFFINTVNGHLWHGIPGAHFKESSGADPNPYFYERLDMHADHWHFDTSGKWSESRDGAANAFGGGHAHIGMMIYQGATWPERFHDRLFTLNMHGFRTNVERLDREGSGYVGRHEPDIFLTGDKWFRGIDIRPGPDGSVYLLDWSDTGECHDHTGVHRKSGRIYRIQYGEGTTAKLMPADGVLTPGFVTSAMKDPDPWLDRQIRQALAGGGKGESLAPLFTTMLREESNPVLRLRAMWNLHVTGAEVDWSSLLGDSEEQVRVWAIRFLTGEQSADTLTGPVAERLAAPLAEALFSQLLEMAKEDKSGPVRLALASTLQRLSFPQRAALGTALAAREEDAADHNLPHLVWFGLSPLAEADPLALVRVAGSCRWPETLRWIARSLTSRIEKNPAALEALLSMIEKRDSPEQLALLTGVSEGLQGWRKATKPESWDGLVTAVAVKYPADEALAGLIRELSVIFGDGRALDEIKALVLNDSADLAMRRAALETLIANRPDDLRQLCEKLLENRHLNAVAVKGLALFDDPALGVTLAKRYQKFDPAARPALMEVLVSRPAWAGAVLKGIESGAIPKRDLSAFHARQISAFEDETLRSELVRIWGEVRESAEDKRKLIEEWTAKLTPERLAAANRSRGRQLFAGICGACHVMYGEGGKIGPDLTGSNRNDLSYLLENILDPGAVVSADYRMSLLTLGDGRVLTGVVGEENDRTLKLRQTTGEIVLEKSEVAKREVVPLSMMPEGLFLAFDEGQVVDLIAYLKHPVQVD
jgi:putative membrane-bound dehydrogenase-like protein